MARMEPWPGGRMASKAETPYMPRFEMVKVPAGREARWGGIREVGASWVVSRGSLGRFPPIPRPVPKQSKARQAQHRAWVAYLPVEYSSGLRRFSCAFLTSSRHLAPRLTMSILLAPLSVGVMSPPSSATAMATLMSPLYLMAPLGSYAALMIGYCHGAGRGGEGSGGRHARCG